VETLMLPGNGHSLDAVGRLGGAKLACRAFKPLALYQNRRLNAVLLNLCGQLIKLSGMPGLPLLYRLAASGRWHDGSSIWKPVAPRWSLLTSNAVACFSETMY
jgi:hypothetical protein